MLLASAYSINMGRLDAYALENGVDAHLVRQQFPPPYSRTTLLNALQTLDFKVGEVSAADRYGVSCTILISRSSA